MFIQLGFSNVGQRLHYNNHSHTVLCRGVCEGYKRGKSSKAFTIIPFLFLRELKVKGNVLPKELKTVRMNPRPRRLKQIALMKKRMMGNHIAIVTVKQKLISNVQLQ